MVVVFTYICIGWQGNMDNQNGGIAMAPGVQGGMTR